MTSPTIAEPTAREHLPLERANDIRLIVADMDGTLLDEHGRISPDFWPLLDQLNERGITFSPASGRQYDNLVKEFGSAGESMTFIAENGSHVVRRNTTISTNHFTDDTPHRVVDVVRALNNTGTNVGAVLCTTETAYVERTDEAFIAEVSRYYSALRIVDDLTAINTPTLKLAIYDFGDSAVATVPALEPFTRTHQVVISGAHWVDVMTATANKGAALSALQDSLGIGPEHTVAFGDYLNDLHLLQEAELSFAMANAHPEILATANFIAPSNRHNGVVRTIKTLLGIDAVS